jgi:hypothetical protein
MNVSRETVRIVVPPLLALGLIAAVTHPADAAPTPAPQSVSVASVGR